MFQLNGLTDCFTLCFRLYEEQVEDVADLDWEELATASG